MQFVYLDIEYNKQPILDFCLKYKDSWYKKGGGWGSPHLELRPDIRSDILEDFVLNPEIVSIYKQLNEQIHEGRIFFKFFEPMFTFARHKDNQRTVGIVIPLTTFHDPLEVLDNEFNVIESIVYTTPIAFNAQAIHQVRPIKEQRWQMQISIHNEPYEQYIQRCPVVKSV